MKLNPLILCIIIITSLQLAQINIRSIESYDVKNGLSQNSVYSILIDSRNLIWIGTESGLNKYDGYDFTPLHSFDSHNSLTTRGFVYDIIEDRNGNIWYTSENNVNKLNIYSESVDNLNSLLKTDYPFVNNTVTKLYSDTQNNLWFGTFGNGFFKVSDDFNNIKNYRNDPDSTGDSSLDYIQDIYEGENGNFWIATYDGLVQLSENENKLRNIFNEVEYEHLRHTTILKIIPFNKELMLFTDGKGILIYNIETGNVYEFDVNINNRLKNFRLRDAAINGDGKIWICTIGGGVFQLDIKNKSLYNIGDFVDGKNKSALNYSLSIVVDPSGIVWIGTQHDGILKIVTGEKKIHTINNSVAGYDIIENNVVHAVSKDRFNKIWLATISGLYKIDPSLRKIKRLKVSDEFTQYYNRIYNIQFVNNSAWISLGPLLIKHDLISDYYEIFDVKLGGNISELFFITEDKFFLGSTWGNIAFYNPSTKELSKITLDDSSSTPRMIYDTYLDNKFRLWIGTTNGMFFIDLMNDSLIAGKLQISLRSEFITSITSCDNNTLWLGTYGDGIYSYNISNSKLSYYGYKEGFPDYVIYGLTCDDNNKLWMSSNKGIFEYDPELNHLHTLDPSDGLQGYEFNSKAYSKSVDGELLFGGINGLNHFYPEDIQRNLKPPPVIIKKVILYDSLIVSNVGFGNDKIYEFSYDQNLLSFEFAALDYVNPVKNSYRYRLEGVSESWINNGKKRYVTFPNISPGEYTFTVTGSNNDQVFNEVGVSFSFVIYPPFWATWWFRTILIITFLALVFSLYMMRIKNQEKRIKEIEAIRKNIADDFHDDLGHKLTRISLYSEMIRNQEQFGTNKQVYLDKINDAANSLFYETKDFIWSLDPGNDSVYDVLVYLKDFGDDFFSRSGIAFKVESIDENFKMFALPMKWKREIILIFKEGMNNIIKHSGATYTELKAILNENAFTLSLCDNGKGFEVNENKLKGRGLTSIEKRTSVINGNLEIISSEKGTTIKLSLNIDGVKK